MENVEIGIATVNYDENGNLISAEFVPTMKEKASDELLRDLKEGCVVKEPSKSADTVLSNAQGVVASWFSKLNEIELADRELYEVKGVIDSHSWTTDGKVETYVIKFTYHQVLEII